jgi:hypothetical protein
MIDYEVLVQTIADWKAGVRPTAPTPPPRPSLGEPQQVEEVSSGVVDLDEDVPFTAEDDVDSGYEEPSYDQPQDSGQYDPDQYDQGY